MIYLDDLTSPYVYLHDLRPAVRLTPLQSRPPKMTEAQIADAIARTLAEDRQVRARAALPDIVSQNELLCPAGRTARASAQDAAEGRPPTRAGAGRMAVALAGVFHRLHARSPDRAERFRAGVDRVATALDALLDRLLERWTTALYMPDFSREALLGDMPDSRPDPFVRLAAEARGR